MAPTRPFSWQSIPTAWAILGIVVALVVGAVAMWRFAVGDVPEMRRDIRELQNSVRAAEERQQAALRAEMRRVDSSLKVLQTNMIAVMQRVEKRNLKPTEMREILSNVRQVTTAEAPHLSAPTLSGQPPEMPAAIVTAVESKPEYAQFLDWFGTHRRPMKFGFNVDRDLAQALFAAGARWEAIPRGIKVTYDGGTAVFPDRSNATPEQLETLAETFNSFSRVLNVISVPGAEVVPPGRKLPITPPSSSSEWKGPLTVPAAPRDSPPSPDERARVPTIK